MKISDIIIEDQSASTKFTCWQVAEDILGKNNIATDEQTIRPNQFLIKPVNMGDAKFISPEIIANSPHLFPGGQVRARNLANFGRRNATDNQPNPMFKDQDWYQAPKAFLGTLEVPLNSRNASDVAVTAHECYHAWMWARSHQSNGKVFANEKMVNQQAEKWLRAHLTGLPLHVALEAITHSRIDYGHNK